MKFFEGLWIGVTTQLMYKWCCYHDKIIGIKEFSVLCPWLSVLWLSSVILLRVSNRKKASLFVWVSGGASRIKRETKEMKENNPIFLLISFLQKLPKFERSEIRGTLLGFWFIAHSALLSGHLPTRCKSRSGLKSLKKRCNSENLRSNPENQKLKKSQKSFISNRSTSQYFVLLTRNLCIKTF